MVSTDNHLNAYSANGQSATSDVYDEAYYKNYCPSLPYEHSPHWLTFFGTLADEIIRIFEPQTILDAGCALGMLVESFWDRGVHAVGIDASHYAIANVRPDMQSTCTVASLTEPIAGTFDLVTCIEVLEHMEAADAALAVENICKVTDTVLFSSTPTGFEEPTHINVRPPIVWIELFAAHGLGPDLVTDATFLTPYTVIFRRGYPCDSRSLRASALISRYRMLAHERSTLLAAETHKVNVATAAKDGAEQALQEADTRVAALTDAEQRLHADVKRATDALAQVEVQAALEAQLQADAREALEAQHRLETEKHSEARQHDLEARQRADAQAALQAQLRSEAVAETQRFQQQLRELATVLHDLQSSNSWRLTRPLRTSVINLRHTVNRFRRRNATKEKPATSASIK